jgi:hypothetical protein
LKIQTINLKIQTVKAVVQTGGKSGIHAGFSAQSLRRKLWPSGVAGGLIKAPSVAPKVSGIHTSGAF